MSSVWQELKRRSVVRVAIGYAIVAWLIVQIIVSVEAPLNLPAWTDTLVIVLLAIGFFVALILAWAYELTPDGVQRTKAIPMSDRVAKLRRQKLDIIIIGLLIVAVGVMFVDNYVLDEANTSEAPPTEQAEEVAPSIAVLPFVDMSPDGDQEYFGDGIAEELLNELVRLDGLRVAGRTSSFSFKGTNADHKTIAEALNVATILEGSIRKDGDRVRITAQLVDVSDGFHLWSETYDRNLEDIFAIQEEIATSVSGALGVRLGVGGVNAFYGAGTRNVAAYEAYLQGSTVDSFEERTGLLERATELDPNYSAAWSALGVVIASMQWTVNPEDAPALKERAYEYVQKAVELDPESAQSNSLLGTILYARKEYIRGEAAHLRAISLRPTRSNLGQYGNLLMRVGRSAAALDQYKKSEAIEPYLGFRTFRIFVALAQKRFADAKIAVERADVFWQEARLSIALSERNFDDIKAAIEAMPPTAVSTTSLYTPVLNAFDSRETVLTILRGVYADQENRWPSKLHDIALLAAYFDDPDFAMKTLGEELRYTSVRQGALWFPLMSEVRKLPEFKKLVTELNIVEYWRHSGWADLCRPLGDTDFECI